MGIMDEARARKRTAAEKNGKPHRPKSAATLPPSQTPASEYDDRLPPEPKPQPEPLGTLLSTVAPENITWLWSSRIPLGKLTVLDGDPGLGKSTATLDIAARVSVGLHMPDGDQGAAPAGVVILSAEDGLADTIVPRLRAAGANLERVLALEKIPADIGYRLPVLPSDMGYLRSAIKQIDAKLVIVDPLMAFLESRVNTHRDSDVRQALYPLSVLAAETGAALVVVRHLNKDEKKGNGGAANPLYRGGGSIAIVGAARSGLLIAKDPDNPDHRVLASTKCNLARLPSSLTFSLEPVAEGGIRVGWIGESTHTAESLLAGLPSDWDEEEQTALGQAETVLRQILFTRRKALEAKQEALAAGVKERTLSRARLTLKVVAERVGFGPEGVWFWRLPS
jgi:AAA domain